MKKEYMKPQMEAIEIKLCQQLLTGSVTGLDDEDIDSYFSESDDIITSEDDIW